jgi:hypothetical protein
VIDQKLLITEEKSETATREKKSDLNVQQTGDISPSKHSKRNRVKFTTSNNQQETYKVCDNCNCQIDQINLIKCKGIYCRKYFCIKDCTDELNKLH